LLISSLASVCLATYSVIFASGIAAKVGKSQKWVDNQLRFGRFIGKYDRTNRAHEPPRPSIPPTLTERAFRSAWAKTPKRSTEGAASARPEA
jgi:hypothetical protein